MCLKNLRPMARKTTTRADSTVRKPAANPRKTIHMNRNRTVSSVHGKGLPKRRPETWSSTVIKIPPHATPAATSASSSITRSNDIRIVAH